MQAGQTSVVERPYELSGTEEVISPFSERAIVSKFTSTSVVCSVFCLLVRRSLIPMEPKRQAAKLGNQAAEPVDW